MRGIWTVARKELSHILRDKVSGLILFVLPALFFISIGFAISIDIERIDLAIANTAGPKANEVINHLCNIDKVSKVVMLNSPSEIFASASVSYIEFLVVSLAVAKLQYNLKKPTRIRPV